ncbi:unnamed protein product [Cyprideis torosa]|uniref:Mitochondrial basic amino acids transporter n=1 Tax=Cyprideis torosa TaxID=163714 RepID=A0A7R8ZQ34_9CRUS|nr:unnamed protein product [Cyprideis torosa]CAG0889708.1 unnamed protein product [Cyprideis torosa]
MALDFFAGCVGGAAGVVVGHPFDTIKVRLQTQSSANPMYKGAVDCCLKTIRSESISGLYKGLTSPLAGVALVNGIMFGTYGNLLKIMPDPDSIRAQTLCGAIGGFCQAFVTAPMELAKTRMQLQDRGQGWSAYIQARHKESMSHYDGPLDCLRKIFRTEGYRGLMRGLGITMVRDVPSIAMYFASYEYLIRWMSNGDASEATTFGLLIAGGLGGVLSWSMCYPIDVIKSRIQADGIGGIRKYESYWDCFKRSYQEDGFRVFTRGLSTTVVRAFPVNATTFGVILEFDGCFNSTLWVLATSVVAHDLPDKTSHYRQTSGSKSDTDSTEKTAPSSSSSEENSNPSSSKVSEKSSTLRDKSIPNSSKVSEKALDGSTSNAGASSKVARALNPTVEA